MNQLIMLLLKFTVIPTPSQNEPTHPQHPRLPPLPPDPPGKSDPPGGQGRE